MKGYMAKWTYRYSCEQRFDKDIVLSQKPQHLGITGDIDEDRKGIFRYRLYIQHNQSVFACLLRAWKQKKAQLTA